MKINIKEIKSIRGAYYVKTGRTFVYIDEFGDCSYSEEIINVCTGEKFGFDGTVHMVGSPDDAFDNKKTRRKKKLDRLARVEAMCGCWNPYSDLTQYGRNRKLRRRMWPNASQQAEFNDFLPF